MKVILLIRSLVSGGAERQLVTLAKALRERGVPVVVVVFYPNGCFGEDLHDADVPVISLDKKGRWDIAGFLFRFIRTLREQRADVIHGYLGTENILLALLKPLLRSARIVWGVRASYMDTSRYDWLFRALYRCEPKLSCRADLIISNSASGADAAGKRGFPPEKIVVIHNGIDTARFVRDERAREKVRSEWNIRKDDILIGRVGRLDPMKDYPTFLKVARLLADWRDDIRFVCVGEGPVRYRDDLYFLCQKWRLEDLVIWAGERTDMPAVYSAMDLHCSSSIGESFPNTVAEAMACGVPCIVTDVGDSASIVGDFGAVVKPGDPETLANGCKYVLRRLSEAPFNGPDIRHHIENNFSVDALANNTLKALDKILQI